MPSARSGTVTLTTVRLVMATGRLPQATLMLVVAVSAVHDLDAIALAAQVDASPIIDDEIKTHFHPRTASATSPHGSDAGRRVPSST